LPGLPPVSRERRFLLRPERHGPGRARWSVRSRPRFESPRAGSAKRPFPGPGLKVNFPRSERFRSAIEPRLPCPRRGRERARRQGPNGSEVTPYHTPPPCFQEPRALERPRPRWPVRNPSPLLELGPAEPGPWGRRPRAGDRGLQGSRTRGSQFDPAGPGRERQRGAKPENRPGGPCERAPAQAMAMAEVGPRASTVPRPGPRKMPGAKRASVENRGRSVPSDWVAAPLDGSGKRIKGPRGSGGRVFTEATGPSVPARRVFIVGRQWGAGAKDTAGSAPRRLGPTGPRSLPQGESRSTFGSPFPPAPGRPAEDPVVLPPTIGTAGQR